MASVIETELTNPEYINYLKAFLGLRELQKGLSPFINRTLQTIHSSLISNIGGSWCGSCTLGTLQVQCRRPCPTNTCTMSILYDEVVRLHRIRKPQFHYTEVWKLFSDWWEFGKCYLPPVGYDKKTSAADCDATGLLSIIINCKELAAIMGATICDKPPKDVFSEVRDIRNTLMHATSHEMFETDMKSALEAMIQVLEYGPQLQQDEDAKHAADEIRKLKDRHFQVTQQIEKDILKEKMEAFEETVEECKSEIWKHNNELEECKLDILIHKDELEDCKSDILKHKDELEECKSDILKHNYELEDCILDVSNHKDELEECKSDVSKHKDELEECKSDVSKHKDELEECKSVASKHKDELEECKSDVSKHKDELAKHVDELNEKLQTVKDDGADVRDEVTNLRDHFEQCSSANQKDVQSIKQMCQRMEKRLDEQNHHSENKELQRLLGETDAKLKLHRKRMKDEDIDMECRLTSSLVTKLTKDKVLVLTGKSGVGKTHQANNILIMLEETTEYSPVMVSSISEVKNLLPSDKPICILFNDIFGCFSVNRESLEEWNTYIDSFLSQVESSQIFMIITLKSVHFNECSSEPVFEVLNKYLTNLEKEGLNQDEKNELMSHFGIKPDGKMRKKLWNEATLPFGLPLLCKLARGETDDISNLIEKPLQNIIEKMEPAFRVALLTTLFSGDSFVEDYVDEHTSVCFEKLVEFYGKHTINKADVISKSNILVGSYLERSDEGTFHFLHDSVLEATFKSAIGSGLKHLLVKYCHLSILMKLGHHLPLTESLTEILLARFKDEQCPVILHGACSLWSRDDFQWKAVSYFNYELDFFTNPDTTGMSLIVVFAGLGLAWLVREVLDRISRCQTIDTASLHHQKGFALFEACYHGQKECASVLLQQPDLSVEDGHLFACMQSKNGELFDFLLDKGGSIEATSCKYGRNLIHEACISSSTSMVKHVVSKMSEELIKTSMDMRTLRTESTPICHAVRFCDLETVEFLLQTGCNIAVKDREGRNLLHIALTNRRSNVVDFIIQKYPMMIGARSIKNKTSLHYAATRGDLKYILLFIEHGLDPMAKSSDQTTLLHMAAHAGRLQLVEYLCEEFPDMICLTDQSEFNAAHIAAREGHLECVQVLLKMGIDPLSLTGDRHTLMHLTSFNGKHTIFEYLCNNYPGMIDKYVAFAVTYGGHLNCLQTLIQCTGPSWQPFKQETLLHLAAYAGRENVVDYLCRKYPFMIHKIDVRGENPAFVAAGKGHLGCVQILIDKGIDPLSRLPDQSTLLHVAVDERRYHVVQYLCTHYPELTNTTDKNGYKPVHRAAAAGHLDCLECLSDKDNFVSGHTPGRGNLDLKALVDKGIRPRYVSFKQNIRVAIQSKRISSNPYIGERYPRMVTNVDQNGCNDVNLATSKRHHDCLKTPEDEGINPLFPSSQHQTWLHYADVESLIDKGIDPMKLDNNGWNAAHKAALAGHLNCLKLLLDEGIDPMSRTLSQRTLLILASHKGRQSIVNYLCEKYPEMIYQLNKDGWSAAHFAASAGHLNCLKILLDKGVGPVSRAYKPSDLLCISLSHVRYDVSRFLIGRYPYLLRPLWKCIIVAAGPVIFDIIVSARTIW